MKVAFYTLGCKTNQFETQALERLFVARGHEAVPFNSYADVYIVNTCTVTAVADKKSRAAARRCKKINPGATLIICGCYAQMDAARAKALTGADFVVGSTGKDKILDIAEGAAAAAIVPLWPSGRPAFDVLPAGSLHGRIRALLKVQDGCASFCSYCIIPYARGPVRSLPIETAASEAARLEREGYREIVITGIEISSYGEDLAPGDDLCALLDAVCDAAKNTRIRLGSLEPRTVTPRFVDVCRRHDNLCPHFHLSLQSGCDDTLRRMNRKYTTEDYYARVELLRSFSPDCAITTDVIVGFPGESERDFAHTLAFMEKCAFSQAHIFPYSKREGTAAAKMPGQLEQKDKEQRAASALSLAREMQKKYLISQVGRTVSVLFEQPENGGCVGHTPHYCEVWAPGENLRGSLVDICVQAFDNRLTGIIANSNNPSILL